MPMMPNRMSAPGKSKRGIAGVLKEVFRYSEKLKVPVAVALLFAVLGAILTIIGPNLLSQITDLISNALQAEIDLAAIGRIGALLLLLYLCSAVFTYVEHYIMATVTLDLSRDMRQDLSRKINRVPMRYFSKVSYGDILSRVTNDVSTLQQALANSLPSMISAAAQFLGCLVMMFVTAAAAGDHIFDFLHEPEMEAETGKRSAPASVRGEVEFEHVRFSYPDAPDKTIIKDFSAHVQPGQKVAIVGPTGAGKTTLVNLLMRFFEINSGRIRIDGISTADMTRESVHDLFSMVLQDTWLFEGTVRENLVYNKTGISDAQIEEACRACGIYHFIETLPKGLDTVLDESIAISAGQKQLLTIARAMIQGNPMLILDEATSSVDTRTELITQRAMDQLTESRTSFVIAHRLSTIKNADLILVLKDGDILEQGTHEQLLAKGGFYADLYNSQFEKAS